MRYVLTAVLLLTSATIFSQEFYTYKGKISDSASGEILAGVVIEIIGNTSKNTTTNRDGKFSVSLPPGKYSISFKILGYEPKQIYESIHSNLDKDIYLTTQSNSLSEVIVSGNKANDNIKNVQMGVERLNIETTTKIPALLGETDLMKTLQLLPGVQSAGEGNIGFYVRGGAGDQNLILLDNATVYNPSHLFGFFSTFNSDAVSDFMLYKGSMPAQYGGRISSILDINTRDGDMTKYKVQGGIGLISSRIGIEGPIQKEKLSFIATARRTYADVIAKSIGVEEVKNSTLYFYDLNAKLSYIPSKKDKVSLTFYHGEDKLGLDKIADFDWGNTIASLKWNHMLNDKRSSTTTLSYTNYKYNVGVDLNTGLDIFSNIQDFNFGQSFSFYPDSRKRFKVGLQSVYRRVIPGELKSRDLDQLRVTPFEHRYSWENALFASAGIDINDRLTVDVGIRASAFSVLGGGNFYNYDERHNVTDTMQTRSGKFVKTYWNIEPRISAVYQLDKNSSVKAGYSKSVQNLHLISTSNMANPTDRWVASTNFIKPETGNQVAVGYFRNFANNMFELGTEGYYKTLSNQIDYKDGAETYDKDNIETELLFGKGRAYGVELFLRKKQGRFSGWASYTLSRTEKKIENINDCEWYPANQDRTHNFSLVGIYELNRKWTLSGTWVYATGSPMTFPSGKYIVDSNIIYYYEGRNKSRAAAFHRLDLGATCILKKTKKYSSELSFSLYNSYARKNPYLYGFRQNQTQGYKSEAYMIYLFSVIPSVTWNFKF